MTTINNQPDCFAELWLRLELTRQSLASRHKRFCIKRVLHDWYGDRISDDFIWLVCHRTAEDGDQICALDELPPPELKPRKCREFLKALTAVQSGIGIRQVDLQALDQAYSQVFPQSPPINVRKKRVTSSEL